MSGYAIARIEFVGGPFDGHRQKALSHEISEARMNLKQIRSRLSHARTNARRTACTSRYLHRRERAMGRVEGIDAAIRLIDKKLAG